MRYARRVLDAVLSVAGRAAIADRPLPAQSTQATVAALGSVSGQVVQNPVGMPVRKIEVSLVAANEAVVFSSRGRQGSPLSALTDSHGHFRIGHVPAGDYRVVLQGNGFVSAERRSTGTTGPFSMLR